jgi:hypothetical protein
MPYAPGIQDISGQLIAQGMSQAGAARARAIESLGESISGGIKQYQQNQMFTQQALGKFGQQLQDPTFKQYVDRVVNDDPNAPQVPDALKKAFKNAAAGKVDIYDAALLGTATEGYQQNMYRQAQMQSMASENILRQVQAMTALQKMQGTPRTYMPLAEVEKRYPNQLYDVSGIRDVAGQPGVVDVTDMKIGGRAPTPPIAPVSVGASGGTLVDPNTGQTRIIPGIPQPGPGEMIVYPQTGGSSAPASLPRFLSSGSMLPSAVPSGQPASKSTEEAIKAVSAASGEQTVPRIVAIPGGEAERKAQTAATARETQTERRLSSAQNILNAIDRIERNKDKTSAIGIAPVGMYSGLRKATSNAAVNVAEGIKTIEANIGFDELRSLKESGTSLGQVAIKELENLQKLRGSISQDLSPDEFNRSLSQFKNDAKISIERIKLLQDAYQSGKSALDGDAKKRFDELGRGFSEDFKATQSIPTAGAVKRLNVQRGESAGSSTLAPAAPDLSAFEGRVLVNPAGKRVRIVNGKEVPL